MSVAHTSRMPIDAAALSPLHLAPLTWGLLAVGYLLGSLSGSLLLGRLRGVDIREHGSGNAGATNALRTQGKGFAAGVALVDLAKGALAAWLALRYAPVATPLPVTAHGYLVAFTAIVGHVWPLWHGFRGGKGAATMIGALLVLWPYAVPVVLAVWFVVVLASGYVGLATVLATWALPLLAWWTGAGTPRLAFSIAVALLLTLTHRGNLARLRAGTESRFARARLLHRWRGGRGAG